jgi:luciferase-type oxidoreductase
MAVDPADHPAFRRVFQPGRLTLGLVLPLTPVGEAGFDVPVQLDLAARADALGFAALWVRDVPLNSDSYPDPMGHPDPWALLGALAARTRTITLVTGAIVAPLRHPLHVAKAALSVDALSGGRFLLGLGAGDRPPEFAAFGRRHEDRRQGFRDNWLRIVAALAGQVEPDLPGETDFRLLPRPVQGGVPMLAVGSAGQTLEWIARHATAWATYHRSFAQQRDRYALWRAAIGKSGDPGFRGFAESLRLELLQDPAAPASELPLGYRLGRQALVAQLLALRDMGTGHVMLNLTGIDRPVAEVLEELAEFVLPAL